MSAETPDAAIGSDCRTIDDVFPLLERLSKKMDQLAETFGSQSSGDVAEEGADSLSSPEVSDERVTDQQVPDAATAISPNLEERLAGLEQRLEALSAHMVGQSALDGLAARIEGRIEAKSNRPVPRPDVVADRQRMAQFFTAMTTFCTRQEALVSRMEGRIAELSGALGAIQSEGQVNRQSILRSNVAFEEKVRHLAQKLEALPSALDPEAAVDRIVEAMDRRMASAEPPAAAPELQRSFQLAVAEILAEVAQNSASDAA